MFGCDVSPKNSCLHQAQLGSTLSLKVVLETINIKTPIFCTNNLGRIHRKNIPKTLGSFTHDLNHPRCFATFASSPSDRSLAFGKRFYAYGTCILTVQLTKKIPSRKLSTYPTKREKEHHLLKYAKHQGGYVSSQEGIPLPWFMEVGKWLYLKGEGPMFTFISFMILGGRVPTDQG